MTDIYEIYGQTVQYAMRLEEILKTNEIIDEATLAVLRREYIKPVTNIAQDWLEEKK